MIWSAVSEPEIYAWMVANAVIFSSYSFVISWRQQSFWWKWFIHSCGVGHLVMPSVMLFFHDVPDAIRLMIMWDIFTATPSAYVAMSNPAKDDAG